MPPNAANDFGTAENANSTYGPIVPLGSLSSRVRQPDGPSSIYRYVQSFGHR